jgi:CheY-like chemotaxis protein
MNNEIIAEKSSSNYTQNTVDTNEHKPFSQDILLIEDDDLCLFAGYEILYRLTTGKIDISKTIAEAKQKLKHDRYDLVVSDLCLVDGNAIDLIAEIQAQSRAKNKNTPFVAVTAYHDIDKHQQALSKGFKAVITKPLTEAQARIFFENYLESYSSHDSTQIIDKPVIDLKLGMERIGVCSEEKAITALELLMVSLIEDLSVLRSAEEEHDYLSMGKILHKLTGALNYSCTPGLEKAVRDLQDVLQAEELSAIPEHVKAISEQVKLLKTAYFDLLTDGI